MSFDVNNPYHLPALGACLTTAYSAWLQDVLADTDNSRRLRITLKMLKKDLKMTCVWRRIHKTVIQDPGLSSPMIGSSEFGLRPLTCFILKRRNPTSTKRSFFASSSYTDLLVRAASFSAHKHRNQRRNNATHVPYINHPLSAAVLLAKMSCVMDIVTLSAAMMHSSVEGTETSVQDLEHEFDMDVARVVSECSAEFFRLSRS